MSLEDDQDYVLLHRLVIVQAVDDYIKLMHPVKRKKKHLDWAWVTSAVMIFDDDYLAKALENNNGQPMDLEAVLMAASDRENVSVTKFRQEVLTSAKNYWEEKTVSTVEIPKHITIENQLYTVKLGPEFMTQDYTVDYEDRYIYLNPKYQDDVLEQVFMQACFEAIAYHQDISLNKKARNQLSNAWFRMMRMNNCFKGVD